MKQNVINLQGIRTRALLRHFNGFKGGEFVVMSAITEEEEEILDKTSVHTLYNGVKIGKENIYFYGDIDINNKNDINLIRSKNLINENAQIRSNFDYEKGNHKVFDRVRCSPCSNIVTWFKYNHCLIGKPTKIIVYKLPKSYL